MIETRNGSCHCGQLHFNVDIDVDNGLFVRCNCSLCSRKNRGVAVVSAREFRLASDPANLGEYRWNTKRERHFFCKFCGIHTHHTLADPPARIGVNLECINGLQTDRIEITDGDGASLPVMK